MFEQKNDANVSDKYLEYDISGSKGLSRDFGKFFATMQCFNHKNKPQDVFPVSNSID